MKEVRDMLRNDCFEDEARAADRVVRARQHMHKKEKELREAKDWLATCEAWLIEITEPIKGE